MRSLDANWLTQDWIDAEYKKYVVLAYLQAVQKRFDERKLCPDIPELRNHYEAGLRFRRRKGTLNERFPKRVAGISGPPPRIEYKSEVTEDPIMAEVDAIVDFALPRFNQMLTDGLQIWQDIAAKLTLEPVGLLPIKPAEGYLFLHFRRGYETAIYQFALTLYAEGTPGGRLVRFQFVDRVRRGLTTPFEHLKLDLIRRYQHLPNPATYRLESELPYPEEETLLPIAQQLIAKALA
ncbi:hypothetical protein F5984_13620 [Rudanella paleaurantiibacter]|uniref:Uncharacterized protein n=1 Tax=Rudanella paleaurantiibacter TaxID=2614655 RepID=A0A7J5TZ28_9BACT|nr:hypothetical protein [Rudanella paleaurantiibacter]KAB7730207.1 hypothetical protein F5984_13620 [Rudanella paleaurantiibacter]